ncbi:MAG: Lrp/AsnC family transcriptional regulator [Promethearchaeota archaeon]
MDNRDLYEWDELDEQILGILSQDSRLGYTQIAKMLKKSHTTIKKRLGIMEDHKVIKNYTIDIDYEKLGYEIVAVIEASIAKGKLIYVQNQIAAHPNVFGVYDVTGDYDSIIFVRFRTRRELSHIIKKILSSEYIIRTNTHVVLNVIKDWADYSKMRGFDEMTSSLEDFESELNAENDLRVLQNSESD